MDPTTAVYMMVVSSSAFPIGGGKYVEVDPGSRIRKDSFDRNSNKKKLNSGSHPQKKCLICFNESPLKMTKSA